MLALLCFLVQVATPQSPRVEVREVSGAGEEVNAHEILVECPNDCEEKVGSYIVATAVAAWFNSEPCMHACINGLQLDW